MATTICCPHCGMWIPLTGAGSKTIAKVQSVPKRAPRLPKDPSEPTMDQVLGDLKDQYWELVKEWGRGKNLAPRKSVDLYVTLIRDMGYRHDGLMAQAKVYAKSLSDPKYKLQLAKWLQQLIDQRNIYDDADESARPSRLSARSQAK